MYHGLLNNAQMFRCYAFSVSGLGHRLPKGYTLIALCGIMYSEVSRGRQNHRWPNPVSFEDAVEDPLLKIVS
jgi:hypothetical protein